MARRSRTNGRSTNVEPNYEPSGSHSVERNANTSSSSSSSSSSSYTDPSSFSASPSVKGVPSEHSSSRDRSVDIRRVFDHYRSYHANAHKRPHSQMKEWRKVSARLNEGYSVEDLCAAIDGCHKSPWHCGENPEHRVYQNLELIVRDSSKVNQFMQMAQDVSPAMSERERRTQRAIEEFSEGGAANG